MQTVQALVDELGATVPMPHLVSDFSIAVNRDDVSYQEIGELIEAEQVVCSRILAIANSPMYGEEEKLDSITRAVTLLGTKQIRDLLLISASTRMLNQLMFDSRPADFWRHAVYCALLARELARLSGSINPDTMFMAGLLHDIGSLVLMNQSTQQPGHTDSVIQDIDHFQLGAELARHWQLPEIVVSCIAHHHDLAVQDEEHRTAVAIVHIARLIASRPSDYVPRIGDFEEVAMEAMELAGLDTVGIGRVIEVSQVLLPATYSALFED